MKLAVALILVLLSSSPTRADEWFTPSMGVCDKADLTPKQLMDAITNLGGDYEVSDSGGKKPSMVFITSQTLRDAGATLDSILFFRTKADCEAAAELAKKYDKTLSDKFD